MKTHKNNPTAGGYPPLSVPLCQGVVGGWEESKSCAASQKIGIRRKDLPEVNLNTFEILKDSLLILATSVYSFHTE